MSEHGLLADSETGRASTADAEPARVSLLIVGDTFPDLPDGGDAFTPLRSLFSGADVVFGNCEGVYSDRPAPAPNRKHGMVAPRERGRALSRAGFDVMTLANNHTLDGGYVGLEDTIALLREQGIAVVGAGPDLTQATAPVILERGGLRIALLGFCSVFPVGYEARANRPGIAPLRIRTVYEEPDRGFWEPGAPPDVTFSPLPADLVRFRSAIAAARAEADVVVVTCHWGYSAWLEVLQSYEKDLAHDAIEHGAHAVVCHHHHSLRGVELHNGCPIYYGLATLVHHFSRIKMSAADRAARLERYRSRGIAADAEALPYFPFPDDAAMTGIATLDVHADGTIDPGFIPAQIMPDGSTVPLTPDDPRAHRIAEYLTRISENAGLRPTLERGSRGGLMHLRLLPPAPSRPPAARTAAAPADRA